MAVGPGRGGPLQYGERSDVRSANIIKLGRKRLFFYRKE